MFSKEGEGSRVGGCDSREGLSPRCFHFLQELCWRKSGSTEDILPPNQNLVIFNWAAPSQLN